MNDATLIRTPFRASTPRTAGFTLVEVLIAMVVMAIGMLGIAGMYVHSLQAGRTSLLRTQAVNLAADIADRIRSNPQGGVNYAGAGADHDCDEANACTPQQIAEYDAWLWDQQRQLLMPPGTEVVVNYDDGVADQPPIYTVSVEWVEANASPEPLNYEIRFGAVAH